MDEFDRAERDDRELERADEHELQRLDWLELHGPASESPPLDDAIAMAGHDKRRAALGTELILEEEMDD